MKNNELLEKDIRTIFFQYLIPAIGGMLGTAAYVVGDTIMVGQSMGGQGLAALNMVLPIFRVINGTAFTLGVGGATTVSILRGQDREDLANNVFNIAMALSTILGVILLLVRFFLLDRVVTFLGATPYTYDMVKDYLSILLPLSIFIGMEIALGIFVRNDGSPKLVMLATLSGSIFNLILDYIFIFIFGWGIWGAAFATVLSPVLACVILMMHFILKKNKLYFARPNFDKTYVKRIIRNGFPSFVVEFSVGIAIYAFNLTLIKISGDMAVSVYGMIMNLALFAIAIFNGVGQAIQPIVSINHGANLDDRAREAGKLGIKTAFVLGVFMCMIGILFPEFLAKIFTQERGQIIDMAKPALRIYFLGFILMGVNIATISYIQSREGIRESIIISVLKGSGFVLVFLRVLPKFLGLNGVWLTVPMAELSTFIFYNIVFKEIRRLFFK